MTYYPCGSGDLGQDEELAVQRSVQGLEIYADASFSLPHKRFKLGIGCPVSSQERHLKDLLGVQPGCGHFRCDEFKVSADSRCCSRKSSALSSR